MDTHLTPIALSLLYLFLIVVSFVAALAAVVLVPLMIWSKPAHALVIRNFVGYFSNPTGYVFLTLFVLLASLATFIPDAFFNNNLASLDQLSLWMPTILLAFIPAITMSIWAEEQQQGTDELLLTLPATDFDIVLGKYLAAAAIYTASLIFAMFTTIAMMSVYSYGEFDMGLFCATFLGYWLMGLAMIAVGMVPSFFTNNLTVAFILGALFNLPFVFASADFLIPAAKLVADTLSLSPEYPTNVARAASQWSYSAQFASFGQGAISLAGIVFFAAVAAVGVYLSMVLIARRHWLSGPRSTELLGHFAIRTLSLIAIAFGVSFIFSHNDFRYDATSKKVASLSGDATVLIGEIKYDKPVLIEAFIGQKMPTPWLKTRYDLINALQQFSAVSHGKVQVIIHDGLELSSDEALLAERKYNIKPERIQWVDRGIQKDDEVLLGAAVTCGLKKQTIPFFSHGVPVEYELARVIGGLAGLRKQKLGILRTDAELMTQADSRQQQLIVSELRQQYDLEDVDPNVPIVGSKIDLLLAVQPSSLTPPQMDNFVAAVESGLPTVIFEDPLPWFMNVSGTDQPKRPRNPQMMMFQQPEQKGDIRKLFKKLGVDFVGSSSLDNPLASQAAVIWQSVNPYPQATFPDEWVFVTPALKPETEKAADIFNKTVPAVADFQEVLFPFPGALVPVGAPGVTITPLVMTGHEAGRISSADIEGAFRQPRGQLEALRDRQGPVDGKQYMLAALIEGKADAEPKPDAKKGDDKEGAKKEEARPLRVLVVSDIDLLASIFVSLRQRPPEGELSQITWRFQNIPFVLNLLDLVSKDDRYLQMRQRESSYVKLRLVDEMMEKIFKEFNDKLNGKITKGRDKVKKIADDLKTKNDQRVARIREMQSKGQLTQAGLLKEVQESQAEEAKAREEAERQRTETESEVKRDVEDLTRRRDAVLVGGRNSLKTWAIVIPLILPLTLAFIMWVRARLREGDTVPKSRNIYTMHSEPAPAPATTRRKS